MGKKVFLGVDGGATKTEVALVAEDGSYLTGIIGGPTRLGRRASGRIIENLNSPIDYVCDQAGAGREDIRQAGFGVHGVDYDDELAGQRRTLFGPLGLDPDRAVLVNDGIVALWGGTPRRKALVLQLGSGFTGAYRSRWGAEVPFDQFNVGLGINLREAVFTTAFRSLDGREARSILPGLIMDHFGIHDLQKLIKKLRGPRLPIIEVLSIITVLREAAGRGDLVSIRLIRRAARAYAHDVSTMIKKIGDDRVDAVLGGGLLLNGPPLLVDLIGRHVRKKHPRARVRRPLLSPALGGCVMAAFHAGRDPRTVFQTARKTIGR